MKRQAIPLDQFNIKAHARWEQWLLLTCGDFAKSDFNAMIVAWGSFGTMWNKPFAQVVVHPTRHTYDFMGKYDSFTLSGFPVKHQEAQQLLGTKSGRGMVINLPKRG